jgi:hypothetical protein
MKKLMLSIVISSAIFYGCSKDEEPVIPPINYQTTNYYPLEIGNYWVYNTYSIDTLGNETLINQYDSAYVSRDTVISGNTYYIIEGTGISKTFVGGIIRNANNSILKYDAASQSDKILFSSNSLGSILSVDTVDNTPAAFFILTSRVNPQTLNKTVDAGSYLCYDIVSEIEISIPSSTAGTRTQHKYLNQNVGFVAFQYTFLNSPTPNIMESRLIRFHVN